MNGGLLPEAKQVLDTQDEGDLMGHPWRFEQLCRASGTAADRLTNVRASMEVPIESVAQSIRRLGEVPRARVAGRLVSRADAASATSPIPRADDGKDTYNEGYVFEGDGALIPARGGRALRG